MTPRPYASSVDHRAVNRRIKWLRALTPDEVAGAVARALVDGAGEDELWAAGALCAARYLNNQARNLLGFVSHAMIGCEDARSLACGQPDHTRRLLIVQALSQVVADLHDPCFAPCELPPFWPTRERSVAANIKLLRSDVRLGEYMRADHRFVALMVDLPPEELIDLLLDIGLEGMITDDHTLISPYLCLGMTGLIGWEKAAPLLRWTLRYSASFPRDFGPYDRAVALVMTHGLDDGAPACPGARPQPVQHERVGALCAALLAAAPARRPQLAATALAEGVTPATVIAAASLAACEMYLMTEPVPHADFDAVSREVAPIHIGTTMNALRGALPLMKPRTRALAAIQAGSLLERGPSVLNADFQFVPFVPAQPYPDTADVASLRRLAPEALLATIERALPAHDHRTATAAVQAYADTGAPAEPLIALLTAVACTDDGTLLHNFKHLHAMVGEYHACKAPGRWRFLAAAARWISWYAQVWTGRYHQAAPILSGA